MTDDMQKFDFDRSTNRILRGIGAVGVTFLINFVDRFALIPLISFFWGGKLLSDWLVLLSAGTFVGMILTGIPTNSANVMTQLVSVKSWRDINVTYSNGLAATILCSFIVAILSCLCLYMYDIKTVLGVEVLSSSLTRQLVLMLVLFNLLVLIISLPYQSYRALGLFARGQMLGNFKLIILMSMIVGGLYFGLDPLGVAMLYLTSILFDLVLLGKDLPKRAPALRLRLRFISVRSGYVLARDGFIFSLLLIGPALSMQGSILLASSQLGASVVLGYILMRTMINFVGTASFSIGRALWPEITLLYSSGNEDRMKAFVILSLKASSTLGCILAAFLFYKGIDLLSVWSGVSHVLDGDTLKILTIAVVSKAIYGGSSIFCIALNRHRLLSLVQLVGGLVTVLLTIPMSEKYGLKGVAFAFVIPDLLFSTLPALLISSRISLLSFKTIFRKAFSPLMIMGLLCILLGWIVSSFQIHSAGMRLTIAALFYFSLATVFAFFFVFSKQERKVIHRIVTFKCISGY